MELPQEEGGRHPVARSHHAAVCLHYGKDSPQVLITGGLDNGGKALSDLWVLDILSGSFKEVSTDGGLFICRSQSAVYLVSVELMALSVLCPSPLEGRRWGKVRIPLLPPS